MTVQLRPVYRKKDLQRILEPRSIAIVGASPTPTSFGATTLENLAPYGGNVYLVNPKYESIGERKCYSSISALPESPDCVIITIGRDYVESTIQECIKNGAGGAIVYAAGFAETGQPEHVALQGRLAELSARSGFRIIGPNIVGVLNHTNGAAMSFSPNIRLSDQGPPAVGLVAQSGGISNGITQAAHIGVTFSHTLASGNSCDVDSADFLAYLAEDTNCRSIALVFEGLASIDRLMEAGELVRQSGKPLVVLKLGRGEAGAAVVKSHTGFLAGSDAAYAAAFRRMGAIMVDSYHALADTAAFFAKAPKPRTGQVIVCSGSGGLAAFSADIAESVGVPLPQPMPELRAQMRQHIPDFGAPNNPCDTTAAAPLTERTGALAEVLMKHPQYDVLVFPHMYFNPPIVRRVDLLQEAAARYGKVVALTVCTDWMGGPGMREAYLHSHVAVFRDTRYCFAALKAWVERGKWLEEEQEATSRVVEPSLADSVATVIDSCENSSLTERESKEVLVRYGIPVVNEMLAHSEDESVSLAKKIGFPVVLKVEAPDLPHKTEAGGVQLNLRSEADVRSAYATIIRNVERTNPHVKISGVLVQPMISGGLEIMVGSRNDSMFGPLIVVGFGGTMVELLKDTVTELAPVNARQALSMLGRLKNQKLLEGFRNSPPVDRGRLADVIVRLSEFAVDHRDRIAEIDVNPVLCSRDRIIAVDALIVKRT